MPKIERTCSTCDATFLVYPSRIKHDAAKYCSYQCFRDDPDWTPPHKAERESRACEQCGKPYEYIPHQSGKRFCSQECYHQFAQGKQHPRYNPESTVTRTCPVCSNQFERPRAWMKYETAYCSRECKGKDMSQATGPDAPNWRGGMEPYYGPNWLAKRRQARHRDDYECQHCGITESELGRQLDVHHIRPFRVFDGDWRAANSLYNLISLCPTCHQQAESPKSAHSPTA